MATRSKHRKNHKEKLEARKRRIAQEKTKNEKLQREFIMNLIKQEQEKGLFNDTPSLNIDGSMIDGPIINGPIIDGPIIDGPIINNTVLSVETETVVEEKESEN
jgi:hypothetical protein